MYTSRRSLTAVTRGGGTRQADWRQAGETAGSVGQGVSGDESLRRPKVIFNVLLATI